MSDTNTPNDQGKPHTGIPFVLNGEKLFAPAAKLQPPQIFEIAWEMKILPFEPDKYLLVSLKNRTVYKNNEYVNLEVDNEFIAQPTTAATVALEPAHVHVPR